MDQISPNVHMVAPADGITVWVLGVLVTMKAMSNETGGTYALFEDIVPPGVGPPTHIHTREEETWYILDGELQWNVGDRYAPGDPPVLSEELEEQAIALAKGYGVIFPDLEAKDEL